MRTVAGENRAGGWCVRVLHDRYEISSCLRIIVMGDRPLYSAFFAELLSVATTGPVPCLFSEAKSLRVKIHPHYIPFCGAEIILVHFRALVSDSFNINYSPK